MATEALKSTLITNRDATPAVLNNDYLADGMEHAAIASIATTSGVTVGSTYRMMEVPSNARLCMLSYQTDAMGGSSAVDVGVYRNTRDGGAVVSAALFASAISLVSAVAETNILNESGTNTIAKQQQPLWQAAGLSADPGGTLDIVATSTATITTGGNLCLKSRWVI